MTRIIDLLDFGKHLYLQRESRIEAEMGQSVNPAKTSIPEFAKVQ